MNPALEPPRTTPSPRRVSFILPCRNAARHLGALVDALRDLVVPPGWEMEIVAGCQASRDDTLQILKERGVTIAPSNELGAGAARNAAVRSSRGSLLVFMDSDTLPADNELLVRIIRKAEELGTFGGLGGPIRLHPSQAWNPVAIADHYACWFNWTESRASGVTRLFQPTTFFVMPRDVFEQVGGFDVRFLILEDCELQDRVIAANKLLYFDRSLSVFHYARGSLLQSCKHSWAWGPPFREYFLEHPPLPRWLITGKRRWFWLNLPSIFWVRLGIIFMKTSREPWARMLYGLPFLLATVLAWSLGATFGKGSGIGGAER